MFLSLNIWVTLLLMNDEHDDKDVLREVRAMFTHTDILARRFFSCSVSVKIVLFRTFCICFFMVWNSGSATICALLTDYDLAI